MIATAAILICLAAAFGVINHRFLKLPNTIGLVVIALLVSLIGIGIDRLWPDLGIGPQLRQAMLQVDFVETLMHGMLSFLLFAGALHVNLNDLAARKWAIGSMATLGLVLSTLIIGFGSYGLFGLLGLGVPLLACLVFGALISPTDPVAVLGLLKSAGVPHSIEAKIAGESLFNDGVAVVIFGLLVAATYGGGHGGGGIADAAIFFAREALGGVLLGLVTGGIAFWLLRQVDEHNLEILITLALVLGSYELALLLHTSGPIAVVVAGLLIGNHGKRLAMSQETREHLSTFWTLLDEILNAVLFLLIGLEVLVLALDGALLLAALLAIPLTLVARLVAVGVPIGLLGLRQEFSKGAVPILTWGGLRGGISVALALSLPESPEKQILLTVCYAVVLFSIIVQGLTVGRLAQRLTR